ncbi:MAG: hypothetical protein COT67_00560 [Candidatus Tagabacteria bacterium CG09_land_8_20_14_0_10_41_14]|uniref:FAD/NAD(P)-binding domain-containing protein n=2 Tax=Candidatus Tagaibacteriota TaxID=1817918 RepID=A0A2H0WLX8_9BACT|nr:MAG: hypothetical protein COT67_00560 [Candidatus Tagabacteria bacterium CG09_land_8_20_14_0_10_41_14]PJE72809.1 MAG: hypothetical protein COV00_03180 [Candidatus Tagabacteria bacterium CG10_big_fil_rev_8_21_14_0_10_40_13]
MAMKKKYSLLIIGAGPAGLTASIYASRYRVDHLVIGEAIGGLVFEAHKICNFPTEQEILGSELVRKMQKHAESLGATLIIDKAVSISRKGKIFRVITQNKKIFLADTLLLVIGAKHRLLNLPNENKFLGKGISYCATCDAMFYRDKTVAVVGGSDSANTASLYLAEVADKVYQIYRKDKLRGEVLWIDQVVKNKKIEVIYNTNVIGLKGDKKLEKIVLDIPYKEKREIKIDGLFIEIGTKPQEELIKQLFLETDENNYIEVSSDQSTSQNGVWAAGDITTASNNFRQIITACSEGAIAVESIFKFFQKNK